MKKFKAWITLDLPADNDKIIEIDDTLSDEKIEKVIKDEVFNYLDLGYDEILDEQDDVVTSNYYTNLDK